MEEGNAVGAWSRRDLVKAAIPIAVVGLSSRRGLAARQERVFAYARSYTSAVDGGANGEGIYRFEMDAHTGELRQRTLVAKAQNPSWIVIHPSKRYLYAINEILSGPSGSVSAYRIAPESGELTLLNTVSSEGSGPAHMSLDATGSFAFVANYAGGTIALLPIDADGRL